MGMVDRMSTPGAPRSTLVRPKFEKPATPSLLVVAITVSTLAPGAQAGAVPVVTPAQAPPWRWLSVGAVVGQVLFVVGWLLAGAIEGHGYSVVRDDISDLTAMTAQHDWVMRSTQGLAAVLTIVSVAARERDGMSTPGARRGEAREVENLGRAAWPPGPRR